MSQPLPEITQEYQKLTKHPEGSMRELFSLSFPLMLSILSGNLMLFLDRLILANYSLQAMNAATAAGMTCMIFQLGAVGVASIAEVFVGQYNGAKQYGKAATPAWQMAWFSLFTACVFIPLALWGGPYLLPGYYYEEYGLPYFRTLLLFGPIFPLQAALSAFFIGIGRVKLVTAAAIFSNILNVLLDFLFIFGLAPLLPEMGAGGAALATGIAQSAQVLVLLFVLLRPYYREKYGSHDIGFKPALFLKCLKIGVPGSFGHMIEISAWALLLRMMAAMGEDQLTLMAVGQSFYTIIAFGMEGLQKGVTAIAANFIGAGKWAQVKKTWGSAVKLLLLIAALLVPLMLLYPDPLINEFLSKETPPEDAIKLASSLRLVAAFVWVYFILDGLTWISAGVLTAAGDTLFVMAMNAFGAWTFAFLPMALYIHYNGSPAYAWAMIDFYGGMNALCFYLRYRQGKWKLHALPEPRS